MKPSEILENLINIYFNDCKREDVKSYQIDIFCNEYKIVIEKSNLGFTLTIFDKENNSRYRFYLDEITAYSMNKKFGLKYVYEQEFKSLKEHLEQIIYEDKIKDMFENKKINELNQELNNIGTVEYKMYIIRKYARKFGYVFDNSKEELIKEDDNE